MSLMSVRVMTVAFGYAPNWIHLDRRQVVLPTIEYEEQTTPLTVADCRAVWTSMKDLDAFAFFNCGYESGAR